MAKTESVQVHCKYDKMVDLSELKPNPDNPNRHPDEQIDLLAKIIVKNGWRERITVSNQSGLIVKGHGRFMAAARAGLSKAPVEYQDYESAALEAADLTADNKIAEFSYVDREAARALMEQFKESKDFSLGPDSDFFEFGFTVDEVSELFANENNTGGSGDAYTRKIDSPVYEPKGESPTAKELFDETKTSELVEEIELAKIPSDIKTFLFKAAMRHTVFHYDRIAEFYCHADRKTQQLMESSGLVIVDFDRAIELGYIKLSEEIANQYGKDYPDA